MPAIEFKDIAVTAMVTTVGDKTIRLEDEKERFGFDDESLARLQRSIGLQTRYVVSEGVCTSDLCVQSARHLFDSGVTDPDEIDALLFVTQSPDYKAPSTAIIMQDRLGLKKSCAAFDINLGCSGFVYGLFTAFSYVNSGMDKVLLCVGDVNSYFSGERDKIFTPLMGDAGSAIIIERKTAPKSFFSLYSDGSGYRHLIIPSGGARHPSSVDSLLPKAREDGSIRRDEDLVMNGKEVFNFAIKTVPPLIRELLENAGLSAEEIDYFVLHQANPYILKTIASRLKVDKAKVPLETGKVYGNQNAASIPGTINAYLGKAFEEGSLTIAIAGFGIGLSWGGAILHTDRMFTPKPLIYEKENV